MTILDPSLRDALRTLKLTGMLETLDARLAQTRAGTLGHLEFLQVLCEDEIGRRETASLTRRIRRARFEEQVTLEGFDFTANPKVPAAQIRGGRGAARTRRHRGPPPGRPVDLEARGSSAAASTCSPPCPTWRPAALRRARPGPTRWPPALLAGRGCASRAARSTPVPARRLMDVEQVGES